MNEFGFDDMVFYLLKCEKFVCWWKLKDFLFVVEIFVCKIWNM